MEPKNRTPSLPSSQSSVRPRRARFRCASSPVAPLAPRGRSGRPWDGGLGAGRSFELLFKLPVVLLVHLVHLAPSLALEGRRCEAGWRGVAALTPERERRRGAVSAAADAGPAPLGVRTDPLGIRADPLGVRAGPLGVRADPLGVRADPLGVRAGPLGVRAGPLGVRAGLRLLQFSRRKA